MTLTTRNTILFILLVLSIAVTFLGVFSVYLYQPHLADFGEIDNRVVDSQQFLLLRWNQPGVDIVHVMIVLGSSAIIAIVGTILVLRYFRRTNAPEVFLFALFLASLIGDVFKLGIPLIMLLDLPPLYGVIITRVVQFCHLFGAFCLFSSTLFATGMDYQRLGNITAVAFIVALAMTYTLPVDSHTLFPSLVYQIGGELTIQLLVLALALFSLVNLANATLTHGSNGFAVYAVMVVLLFVGREIVFLLPGLVLSLAGGVAVLGGALGFGIKKYVDYLWV